MFLVALLLMLLVPISWAGLLISWSAWMSAFQTGKAIEPSYLFPLGLFSLINIGLQILLLISLMKEMIEKGDGAILVSMIFYVGLMLTALIVVFS